MKRPHFLLSCCATFLASTLSAQFGTEHVINDTAANFGDILLRDFDSDGDLDISGTPRLNGHLSYWENDGVGDHFTEHVVSAPGEVILWAGGADMDSDGDVDLLVATEPIVALGWYENTGGTFGPLALIAPFFSGIDGANTLDIDADGDEDLLVSKPLVGTVLLLQGPTGQFTAVDTLPVIEQAPPSDFFGTLWKVELIDLDADSDLDLLALDASHPACLWYERVGPYAFVPHIIAVINDTYGMEAYDQDMDGDMDVLLCDDGIWHFMENDGSGSFTEVLQLMPEHGATWSNMLKDMDNDGDLDILYPTTTTHALDWLENTGGLNVVHHDGPPMPGYEFYTFLAKGDLSGDGVEDIVFCSHPNYLRYFEMPSTTGIATHHGIDNLFSIHPNPSGGSNVYLNLKGALDATTTIAINDALGRCVFSDRLPNAHGELSAVLDLQGKLRPGIYLIVATSGEMRAEQRLVIE